MTTTYPIEGPLHECCSLGWMYACFGCRRIIASRLHDVDFACSPPRHPRLSDSENPRLSLLCIVCTTRYEPEPFGSYVLCRNCTNDTAHGPPIHMCDKPAGRFCRATNECRPSDRQGKCRFGTYGCEEHGGGK